MLNSLTRLQDIVEMKLSFDVEKYNSLGLKFWPLFILLRFPVWDQFIHLISEVECPNLSSSDNHQEGVV